MFARPYVIPGLNLNEVSSSVKPRRQSNFVQFNGNDRTPFPQPSLLSRMYETNSVSINDSDISLNEETLQKHRQKIPIATMRDKFLSSQIASRLDRTAPARPLKFNYEELLLLSRFKIICLILATKLVAILIIQVRLMIDAMVSDFRVIEVILWTSFVLFTLLIRFCIARFSVSNVNTFYLFVTFLILLSNACFDMALGELISDTLRPAADRIRHYDSSSGCDSF